MELETIIRRHYPGDTMCTCGYLLTHNNGGWSSHVADAIRKEYAVVRVPSIAFKGPFDTDVSVLEDAADRIEGGFYPGGSHTAVAVVQVLRDVASQAGGRA